VRQREVLFDLELEEGIVKVTFFFPLVWSGAAAQHRMRGKMVLGCK